MFGGLSLFFANNLIDNGALEDGINGHSIDVHEKRANNIGND